MLVDDRSTKREVLIMSVMCYPVVLLANSADYGNDNIIDVALLAELASEAAGFLARFTRSAKPARPKSEQLELFWPGRQPPLPQCSSN